MASLLYTVMKDLGFGDYALIIIVLTLFVDLTPGIKWNPIKFIFKKLGDAFNHSIETKINSLEEKRNQEITEIKEKIHSLEEQEKEQSKLIKDQVKLMESYNDEKIKITQSIVDLQLHTSEQSILMKRYTEYIDAAEKDRASLRRNISILQEQNKKQFNLLEKQSRDIDVAEVNRLKMEILNFSNRLGNKQTFTAEEYRTIMDCYTRYHTIIDKYSDMNNGKIDIEYGIIKKHYEQYKDSGEYRF